MQKLYRFVMQVAYFVGLLTLLVGIVLRILLPNFQKATTAHGLFEFAAAVFLCALASHVMSRSEAS
jgi:hypothetical protein